MILVKKCLQKGVLGQAGEQLSVTRNTEYGNGDDD